MTGPRFSGALVTVLTMAGVSIGLGNVWRFPYMMGQHGGSAFLVVYLLFAVLISVPALTAEWALGRETRQGPVGAFARAFGERAGRLIGLAFLFGVLIADSYYIVIIANISWSTGFSLVRGFSPATLSDFQVTLGNGPLQYALSVAIAAAAAFVVHRGLRRGIEVVSRLFVPFFALAIIYLVIHTMSLPGALAEVGAFMSPDFSEIGGREIFAAMGQAFYSVGVGGTLMLVYGSYLNSTTRIPGSAAATVFSDVGAAVMASLFIVPAVLVYGLNLESGPGLIFETLPRLFAEMPGGRWLAPLFLLALTLVAFLSAVAAIEVFVAGFSDGERFGLSRDQAVVIALALLILMMLPSALYPPFIGWADLVFGSGMMVTGGLIAIVALTWRLGRATTLRQIFGNEEGRFAAFYYAWLRWVIPVILLAILIGYIQSVI